MSVLAVQPGAIGNLVLSLPALAAVRQMLGKDRMEIWAERTKLPLVAHPAYADRVRPIETTGIDSYPVAERTLAAMRKFDLVVSWRGAKFPELTKAVKAVHGHAYFPLQFPPAGQITHLTDFRRSQVRALFEAYLGATRHSRILEADPSVLLSAEDREFAEKYWRGLKLREAPTIVFHPGASGAQKRWEPDSFAKVARPLGQRGRCNLLVTRGPLDREPVEQFLAALKGIAVQRVEIGNLRSLAAVLARAELFIGNDSGITHLAAAVQTPTIAVFICTDPRVWAPRGRRVEVLTQPRVEQVSEAAEKFLAALETHHG